MRRLRRGEIDRSEFGQNLKRNTVGTIGSVIGGTLGLAIGLPVGEYIADGIGAFICGVVGGVAGGVAGERYFISAEQRLEDALSHNRT